LVSNKRVIHHGVYEFMYIPKQFHQSDQDALVATIRTIKLGALVIFSQEKFISSHIPFIVKEEGNDLMLEGHVARANELWQHALIENKALVIFQGAHAYIHPG
jgi:transcriptional regulator